MKARGSLLQIRSKIIAISTKLIWTGFVAVSKASKSYNGYVVPKQCNPIALLYCKNLQAFLLTVEVC